MMMMATVAASPAPVYRWPHWAQPDPLLPQVAAEANQHIAAGIHTAHAARLPGNGLSMFIATRGLTWQWKLKCSSISSIIKQHHNIIEII